MVLLRDVGQVDARIGPFEDTVNLKARGAWFVPMFLRLAIVFGVTRSNTRWYSIVTRVKWKLVWVRSKIMLISMQHRYIVLR
jgi:hypothetical protein